MIQTAAPTVNLQEIFFGLPQSCKVMWSCSLVPPRCVTYFTLVLVPGQPTFTLILPPSFTIESDHIKTDHGTSLFNVNV